MLNGDAHHSSRELRFELRICRRWSGKNVAARYHKFGCAADPVTSGSGSAGAGGGSRRGLACSLGEDRGELPPPLNLVSLTILLVEDDKLVSEAVRHVLEAEGWRVESCADGNSGMNRIAGGFAYDLLIFDNDLPGASGIELTRYARSLPIYRSTPIIMVSATDCGAEARSAGADLFLSKPEGVTGFG
jgi:CheY-like chemotaxis protein